MTKQKIVLIVGPTAVGKTALSIDLAKRFNGEIINGDSMQVYQGLDIGTAKIKESEKDGIPHHLLDILKADQAYSASHFQDQARQCIQDIAIRRRLPIVVGGTGLYIEALIYDVSHGGQQASDPAYRRRLQALEADQGGAYLWEVLNEKDPQAAAKIHPNNSQRLIRALEVIHQTGQPFSALQDERQPANCLYDCFIIGLNTDRSILYQRINQRVDDMMEAGLLEEARHLFNRYGDQAPAAKGIGYKEFFPYFKNEITLDQALADLKQASRRYAKRQLTWFRNRTPVDVWVDLVQDEEADQALYNQLEAFLADKGDTD